MKFAGVEITQETILKTRQHFVDNAYACIAEVMDGKVKVNDSAKYFTDCLDRAAMFASGRGDYSVTFAQRAHWIQTGECIALLP